MEAIPFGDDLAMTDPDRPLSVQARAQRMPCGLFPHVMAMILALRKRWRGKPVQQQRRNPGVWDRELDG